MNRLTNKNYFETTAFDLVCTLVYLGFKIESIERKDQPRANFIFQRKKGMDQVIKSYWKGKLSVEPKRFYYCQREIKAMLYQEGRQ